MVCDQISIKTLFSASAPMNWNLLFFKCLSEANVSTSIQVDSTARGSAAAWAILPVCECKIEAVIRGLVIWWNNSSDHNQLCFQCCWRWRRRAATWCGETGSWRTRRAWTLTTRSTWRPPKKTSISTSPGTAPMWDTHTRRWVDIHTKGSLRTRG